MTMTTKQARKIIGKQPSYAIRNMRRALELHPWLNTVEDWERLNAAYCILRTPTKKRITP